jgi:hypothetical protein
VTADRLDITPLTDAAVFIADRTTLESYFAYRPATGPEIRCGHDTRRWYVRRPGDIGNEPFSRPFESLDAAVAAIRDGSWDLVASYADRRPIKMQERRCNSTSPGSTASSRPSR